jgi:hypothetical protein
MICVPCYRNGKGLHVAHVAVKEEGGKVIWPVCYDTWMATKGEGVRAVKTLAEYKLSPEDLAKR